MILPIELIIYTDQYSTNHNILLLSKLINKKIKQSNNSQYWISKYLEKTFNLGISNLSLDVNNIISKYEYLRLIKQSNIIENMYIFFKNDSDYYICSIIKMYKIKDFSEWYLMFRRPYCSFNMNKLIIPKELNKFNVTKMYNAAHHIFDCHECTRKSLKDCWNNYEKFSN